MANSFFNSRRNQIKLGIAFSTLLFAALFLLWALSLRLTNIGYEPTQPLPFDHSVHAGKYQISCKYCHNQVERSRFAGIPPLETCMNCHHVIATESPHIQRLTQAYNAGQTIPWVRVHMLPDHARFNHSGHDYKGVSCKECHGDVANMPVVSQKTKLNMGMCLECHRKEEYKAPQNCSTCHNN